MERLLYALTFVSALGAALVAGIFFAFSSFVMSALGRLPPANGISAMQSINVVVLNPVFFTAFLGTALLCLVLGIAAYFRWSEPGAGWLLAGSLLYLIGCLLVTVGFNVPLNDALEAVKPESAEGANLWKRYLSEWTMWNHVRTVAPLASAASFVMALR